MVKTAVEYNQLYSNWFVIQVQARREYAVKEFLDMRSEKLIDIVIFSKEIIRDKHGIKKRIIHPLFPSYIFVKKNVQIAIDTLKKRFNSMFIKPVCLRSKKCNTCFTELSPCMVLPEEMKTLFDISNSSRVFEVSSGYKEGNEIIITGGPLSDLKGNILYINEKKKVVNVSLSLFKRKMKVALGIEFIKKL